VEEVILITGSTGTVGVEIIAQLAVNSQYTIRCATRNPSSVFSSFLKDLSIEGKVVPVELDLNKPETIAKAMENVTRLFLLPPFVEDLVPWHHALVDAAKKAGVQWIIKQSVLGARAPTPESVPNPIPLMHWNGEEIIRNSGIPCTMIRPTIFAQHLTKYPWVYQNGDQFYLPIGEGKVAWLDARDISTVVAHLLSLKDPSPHFGKAYNLTGPKAITGSEMSQILSNVKGKKIEWVDSLGEFEERLKRLHPDPWAAKQALVVYHDCKEGWLGKWISPDFQNLIGRSPTPFAKFVFDHFGQNLV